MAGLDPAIQTCGFRAWMPGSRPGMTVRVTNNEIWYNVVPTIAAAAVVSADALSAVRAVAIAVAAVKTSVTVGGLSQPS